VERSIRLGEERENTIVSDGTQGVVMASWFATPKELSHEVVIETLQSILSSCEPVTVLEDSIVPEWEYSTRFLCKTGNDEFETLFCFHNKDVLVLFCYES